MMWLLESVLNERPEQSSVTGGILYLTAEERQDRAAHTHIYTETHTHMPYFWLCAFKESGAGINYSRIHKKDFLLCPCEAEE